MGMEAKKSLESTRGTNGTRTAGDRIPEGQWVDHLKDGESWISTSNEMND